MLRHLLTIVALFAIGASGCGDGGPSAAERAAAREAEQAAEAKLQAEREAEREGRRLAALWTYHDVTVDQERQQTAAINSLEDVDTDGRSARSVRLIFRDHSSWGRSSYLVLQAGDFDCSPRCVVSVTADSFAPAKMNAWRPVTDEAIAMFIDDAQGLWRLATSTDRISIDFPVKAGGTRTASFEVAGLDASKLPGWE
ncbi:MAG: hypothetical protein AB7P22_03310 [Vicinamibacterales bacterium]